MIVPEQPRYVRNLFRWATNVALVYGIIAAGIIFIGLALMKAFSPVASHASLGHLLAKVFSPETGIESTQVYVVLVCIIGFEVLIGTLLLSRWRPRLTLGVAIGALVVFSITLGVLILDESAPSCGCSGAFRLADDARTENTIALGRNLLLIAACVWLRGRAGLPPMTADNKLIPHAAS